MVERRYILAESRPKETFPFGRAGDRIRPIAALYGPDLNDSEGWQPVPAETGADCEFAPITLVAAATKKLDRPMAPDRADALLRSGSANSTS
jgi:hypothetical protein